MTSPGPQSHLLWRCDCDQFRVPESVPKPDPESGKADPESGARRREDALHDNVSVYNVTPAFDVLSRVFSCAFLCAFSVCFASHFRLLNEKQVCIPVSPKLGPIWGTVWGFFGVSKK